MSLILPGFFEPFLVVLYSFFKERGDVKRSELHMQCTELKKQTNHGFIRWDKGVL